MSDQIPPPFPVPGTDDKDKPQDPDTPDRQEDPSFEEEDYKLPPMEPPAPIREPRVPGA